MAGNRPTRYPDDPIVPPTGTQAGDRSIAGERSAQQSRSEDTSSTSPDDQAGVHAPVAGRNVQELPTAITEDALSIRALAVSMGWPAITAKAQRIIDAAAELRAAVEPVQDWEREAMGRAVVGAEGMGITVTLLVKDGPGAAATVQRHLNAWFTERWPGDPLPFPPGTLLHYSIRGGDSDD